MALVACKECSHEISTTAKACPQCGAKPKRTKWWLWAPLGFVALLFVWGAITGPKDTAELARMETEACMRTEGGGAWRASSGITLEKFCQTAGAVAAYRKACEINPSKC